MSVLPYSNSQVCIQWVSLVELPLFQRMRGSQQYCWQNEVEAHEYDYCYVNKPPTLHYSRGALRALKTKQLWKTESGHCWCLKKRQICFTNMKYFYQLISSDSSANYIKGPEFLAYEQLCIYDFSLLFRLIVVS